ncbi:MAG TPA: CpsD/CapB family tyrosine-protein kinase [Bryobacteraceae bacterium]|jgi:receptor protein-tyrosine kinase|nr:CpsD/CapB family tyrosine-protein kinase [Bryobacteraceae bacterium]
MSRVHDALRKAATEKTETPVKRPTPPAVPDAEVQPETPRAEEDAPAAAPVTYPPAAALNYAPVATDYGVEASSSTTRDLENLEELIVNCRSVPFTPGHDTLLMNPARPKDAPSEEFRSLRTRLNHLQSSQNLHTIVISSASPGEGKSFTAANLAISQAQLTGKRILLADFDFRRPSISKLFGISPAPGLTDYLRGKARIGDMLHHIADSNLYVLTAGEIVTNPLELLNLPECNRLLEALRDHFDWVILDSPPLLFAADGNLLSTMADGTILVVRIGNTTYDSITRAVQSLCENNVLGVVVNGANHNELYNRYSYYHSYYYSSDEKPALPPGNTVESLEPAAKR